LHHLADPEQRRERDDHDAPRRRGADQALAVDVLRRLLVEVDELLLGALERAPALVVGLEPEQRPAARRVLDLDGVDEVGDALLPGHLADALARDEAGAVDGLAVAAIADLAEQLLLEDVAGGLVGVAGDPGADRAPEHPALPPRPVAPGQVAGVLPAAGGGLADLVGGHEAALAVDLARGEMLHVPGIELARPVGEALARRGDVGEQVLEQPEAVEVVLRLEHRVERLDHVERQAGGDRVGELVDVGVGGQPAERHR
jgi:hypothetical protein